MFSSIYKLRLIFAGLVFCLAGCFSVGLPEPLSEVSLGPLHQGFSKKVLFLSDAAQINSASAQFKPIREGLGSQYVLGFFPLTNVYLEHGKGQLVTETIADELVAAGFETFIGDIASASKLSDAINPNRIISVSLDGLRINAFDLLFLRKLSITGSLVYREHSIANPKLVKRQIATALDDSRYQKYGLPSDLSLFLQNLVKENFRKVTGELEDFGYGQYKSKVRKKLSSGPTLVVQRPKSGLLQFASLGKELSHSYGDYSYPAYNRAAIERIVQRGLHAGSLGEDVLVLSSSLRSSPPQLPENTMWLETLIEFIEIDPADSELRLELSYSLVNSENKLLFSGSCKGKEIHRTDLDGSWVRSLEISAEKIIKRILNNNC